MDEGQVVRLVGERIESRDILVAVGPVRFGFHSDSNDRSPAFVSDLGPDELIVEDALAQLAQPLAATAKASGLALESIPRQWKVIHHVREKFTCRDCDKIR